MERIRPGSRHGGVEPASGAHRRRRVTSPGRAGDLFLEMAKDTAADQDTGSTASQAGSPGQIRAGSHQNPQHQQYGRQPSITTPVATKQYPSTLSLHNQSGPTPPNTAPPISSQRYFRTHLSPALASETRRASAGEISASMRPFKPTARSSQLSALAFDSPRSVDSSSSYQTTDPSPATPSCADGVDSVGSVTAVSMIWDEAEELNAKLKQYRSGGRRIRSSGEHPDERPRTGTTWTTTASNRSSALRQALTADGNAKHQLLRTALERLRGKVDHDVYRQLENSVADVISASTVLAAKKEADADGAASIPQIPRRGNAGIENGEGRARPTTDVTSSDPRLRRKIDSLCQSLTDLCIALNNSQRKSAATFVESPVIERPRTRGSGGVCGNDSPISYLDQRRARIGSSSRAPSRISENREPETQTPGRPHNANPVYAGSATSERECSPTTFLHPSMPSHSTASLYRPAASTAPSDSQDAGSSDRVSTIRASSRAATEAPPRPAVAPGRTTGENRYKSSADHINHLQLPNGLSPSLRKTLATNHSNLSLNSAYSAATYAGESRGPSAASKLLQDRLDRKRRDMEQSSFNRPSQAREYLAARTANTGQRSRGISGSASTANLAQRPGSRGLGY